MEDGQREETTAADQLLARLDALESSLDRLRQEVRTSRLAVLDRHGAERLVAQVVDGVLELHLPLPGAGESDGLLLFSSAPTDELPPGCGLQIWSGGDAVRAVDWWAGS